MRFTTQKLIVGPWIDVKSLFGFGCCDLIGDDYEFMVDTPGRLSI